MSTIHLAAPALPGAERRRAPRFSLLSLVTVATEKGEVGHCSLENLSSGGALLRGSLLLLVGEAVRVVLPSRDSIPVSMVGRIVRRRPQSFTEAQTQAGAPPQWAYGVMFAGASIAAAERSLSHVPLDAETSGARSGLQPRPVLVLDASAAACAPTVATLAAAGVPAVGLSHAFDALAWLSLEPFAAAVVNPQPLASDGADLLRYLADEHPNVRRVAIHANVASNATSAAQLLLHGPLGAAHVQHLLRSF